VIVFYALCFTGPRIQEEHSFLVQPIGTPVGRNIGAVAPDGAQLLSASRLPYVLAVFNILLRKEHLSGGAYHLYRNGRCFPVNFNAIVAQHGEGTYNYG